MMVVVVDDELYEAGGLGSVSVLARGSDSAVWRGSLIKAAPATAGPASSKRRCISIRRSHWGWRIDECDFGRGSIVKQ